MATVVPNVAGFSESTASLRVDDNDTAGVVTFTTSTTIPDAGPFLLFTIVWAGSWAMAWINSGPVVQIGVCADATHPLPTAAQLMAAAALGPFAAMPNESNTSVDVYCTNAPAENTSYQIAYQAIAGP
jgi:hypothetical protein